jgi:hypothetical protein
MLRRNGPEMDLGGDGLPHLFNFGFTTPKKQTDRLYRF